MLRYIKQFMRNRYNNMMKERADFKAFKNRPIISGKEARRLRALRRAESKKLLEEVKAIIKKEEMKES